MSAIIIDGKAVAKDIRISLKKRVNTLIARGVTPRLSVILASDDAGSAIYVRNKETMCARVGILSETIRMGAETTQAELTAKINELNADPDVDGILLQLPLYPHLDAQAALATISPDKDADGIHEFNAGRLLLGLDAPAACTPSGCIELLKRAGVTISGANAVVIGRSNIVGKPMALMLMRENATVTICHSRTRDIAAYTRAADIVVAALGRPGFLTADMVKPGAAIIDVGINRLPDGKVVGDVDFDNVKEIAGCITPVPGGVGPMTIAMLLYNTVAAAEKHAR